MSVTPTVPPAPGRVLTLEIERPAAGGRMLARLDGRVVLVHGAIPGERVRARVERTSKGVVHAETLEVLTASNDRRAADDPRCGGQAYAHVAYPRLIRLKADIIQDGLARIGKIHFLLRQSKPYQHQLLQAFF
jgi:23S rRNA (uracil1939-C5)-methyltransferase